MSAWGKGLGSCGIRSAASCRLCQRCWRRWRCRRNTFSSISKLRKTFFFKKRWVSVPLSAQVDAIRQQLDAGNVVLLSNLGYSASGERRGTTKLICVLWVVSGTFSLAAFSMNERVRRWEEACCSATWATQLGCSASAPGAAVWRYSGIFYGEFIKIHYVIFLAHFNLLPFQLNLMYARLGGRHVL